MQGAMIERFPDRVQFRVPRGLPAAIKTAAARRYTSPAEWARQKLLGALEADGIAIEQNNGGLK